MSNSRKLVVAFCPVLAAALAIYFLSGKWVLIAAFHGVIAVGAYAFYIFVKIGRTGKLSQVRLGLEPSTDSENLIRLFAILNLAIFATLGVMVNSSYGPNPAVNSDVPVKVIVLVNFSGGTPVTSVR